MSLGIKLNNPFDLEISPDFVWRGEVTSASPPFCAFASSYAGIRAGVKDLYNQQLLHQLYTVFDIIEKYAPPSENDTDAYIRNVADALGVDPHEKIDLSIPTVLVNFAKAVIVQEQGQNPYPDELIELAVGNVLGKPSTTGATS